MDKYARAGFIVCSECGFVAWAFEPPLGSWTCRPCREGIERRLVAA